MVTAFVLGIVLAVVMYFFKIEGNLFKLLFAIVVILFILGLLSALGLLPIPILR